MPSKPRGDIDAVAHQIAVALLDDVADMNPDAEFDSAVLRHAGVALDEAVLNFDRAADRVHDAAKLDDAAVAGAFDDAAVMSGDGRIDEIAAEPPEARKGPILVGASEPAITDDIRQPGSPRAFGSRSSRPSWSRHSSRNASPQSAYFRREGPLMRAFLPYRAPAPGSRAPGSGSGACFAGLRFPWSPVLASPAPQPVARLRSSASLLLCRSSDFSGSCIGGYGSSPSRRGPCDPTGLMADPEISRFPRKERPYMPGSKTTPGRSGARVSAPDRIAFR